MRVYDTIKTLDALSMICFAHILNNYIDYTSDKFDQAQNLGRRQSNNFKNI
jgi:hypothetical protein